MSKQRVQHFLEDILEAIRRSQQYTSELAFEDFKDTKTQDAVIRTIQIIGEPTKNLTSEFREEHPQIPRKNMARTRD